MNEYRLDELKADLSVNHEVEFKYKGYKCFIGPVRAYWELWVNDECILREQDVDTFLETKCLDDQSISEIFSDEIYDLDSLFIF